MGADRYEALRERYRPEQTSVLLIGESRPANGTFFYCGNSRLAKYTREAFKGQHGPFRDVEAFLRCFRNLGCYLIDLCPMPVNHMPKPERKRERQNGESKLACTLAKLKPRALIIVMKAIARLVYRAAKRAGLERTPCYVLPFPAQGHEKTYVRELSLVLNRLKAQGVLPEAC